MPRSSQTNHYTHENLGKVLRWLREQRKGMTRKAISEAIAGSDGVSVAYLRKLEIGERNTISRDKLATLLVAYGSTVEELEALLVSEPWQGRHETQGWKPTAATPEPAAYRQAAAQALSSHSGTWSTAVQDPTQAQLIQGQATELVEHFVRLSAAERAQMLDEIRRRRFS